MHIQVLTNWWDVQLMPTLIILGWYFFSLTQLNTLFNGLSILFLCTSVFCCFFYGTFSIGTIHRPYLGNHLIPLKFFLAMLELIVSRQKLAYALKKKLQLACVRPLNSIMLSVIMLFSNSRMSYPNNGG